MFWLLFPGLGSFFTLLMSCACIAVAIAWFKKSCGWVKKFDIRNICGIGRFFLRFGIDRYEKFSLVVQVHSVKDLPKTSLIGGPKLIVVAYARYEECKTRVSAVGKWEQSLKLIVPQGTSEVILTLWDKKLVGSDVEIGSAVFDLETQIMSANSEFFGKKRLYKLTKEDAAGSFGQVAVTFRKGGDKGSTNEEVPMMKGFDADQKPALYGALLDIMGEKDPSEYPKNLEGQAKLELLAQVIQGKLETPKKGSLSGMQTVFCAVCELYPPGSESDDGPDMGDLILKAKKKGLGYVPKKWFWCVYESKKDFLKDQNKTKDMFPILSISSVHLDQQNPGDFFLRYFARKPKKAKVEIRYHCSDRDVEAWTDAMDEFREECRSMKDQQQKHAEHFMSLTPSEKFAEWAAHYRSQGYSDEELKKWYEQSVLATLPEAERAKKVDERTKQAFYGSKSGGPKAEGSTERKSS